MFAAHMITGQYKIVTPQGCRNTGEGEDVNETCYHMAYVFISYEGSVFRGVII